MYWDSVETSYMAICVTLVWGLGSSFDFTWYIVSQYDVQKLVGMSAVSPADVNFKTCSNFHSELCCF